MATDYGGTYGDPPWPGAQPPHPGQHPGQAAANGRLPWSEQPHYGDQAGYGPSGYGPSGGGPEGWPRRSRATFLIALTALVLGLVGLAAALVGVAAQLLPRHFTAAEQQQIINWDYGQRWRDAPASAIFPAAPGYAPPAALDDDPALALSARRIGIAREASCRAAADTAAAAILDRDGCTQMLRATYADSTYSYVLTVGVAVLPGTAQAAAAARALALAGAGAGDPGGIAPGVHAVPVASTAAAQFTDKRRQLSGAISAGSYVVLYTAGYADSRPREPIASDSYGDAEMTAVAAGVARAVLAVLAAPVPPPKCPGMPAC